MVKPKTIYAFEYGSLQVGATYNGITFTQPDFDHLAKYLTVNPKPQYYSLLHKRIKFCNYVGIIKVRDLTIEVLPKTDRHDENHEVWQSVLLNMLAISLDVEAQCTTNADIQIKRHSVLETYIQLFLDETKGIIHHGLVKKYRQVKSNQTSLKGKLLIHQHVSKNLVHAERFYVTHTIYDRDNIYNFILRETLECICELNVSDSVKKLAGSLLLDFPECRPIKINQKLFERLTFDRKTERYRTATQLARVILLNYHPDVKGGTNNVLAIMFDMNHLWENYVYWVLKRASANTDWEMHVQRHRRTLFWQHPEGSNLKLVPDLLVDIKKDGVSKACILDTKWKYRSDTSMEDVRQMFAYSHYFKRPNSYLLYPDKMEDPCSLESGSFYEPQASDLSHLKCGVGFVNLLLGGHLNRQVGGGIIKALFEKKL
jgi:5-methylcytosine-specific restriction enzyme subunit McrC